MMKVIGITGGAGSGKSVVLDLMKTHFGACVIIADEVARQLSQKGHKSYQRIVDYFGEAILQESGEIDRVKLASIVFGNNEKLEKLNSFVHPLVKEKIESDIKAAKHKDYRCIVIEAALLIEDGYRAICDEIWYIYTEEGIRRQRLKTTRNYSDEKINAIIASQLSEEDFRKNSDKIIENNGSIELLHRQIESNL